MAKQALSKTAAQKLADAMLADPFIGPDSQIDWSGCPSVNTIADADFDGHSMAPLTGVGGEDASALRRFLEAEFSREQGGSHVQLGNVMTGPVSGELTEAPDGWTCTYEFDGARYVSKGRTREDAAMAAARYVQNYMPDTRELTAEEEQTCAWLAECGKPVESAEQYLRYAIPRAGVLGMKVFTDQTFAAVIEEAVFFAWSRSRNDYSLADTDFPHYLARFAKHKRLTLAICDAAWTKYQADSAKAEREALFQPEAQPDSQTVAAGLEEMSDAQIDAAMKSVTRMAAKRAAR
jgi:hypothetical protein